MMALSITHFRPGDTFNFLNNLLPILTSKVVIFKKIFPVVSTFCIIFANFCKNYGILCLFVNETWA